MGNIFLHDLRFRESNKRHPLEAISESAKSSAIYGSGNRRFIHEPYACVTRKIRNVSVRNHSRKPWKIMTRPKVPLVNFERAIRGRIA